MSDPVQTRLERLTSGLVAPLREAVSGLISRPGKSLRSRMLTVSAGFGRFDPLRVARLGAVVELVHLASLVHDDVVDRAAIRRGGPAAHEVAGPEIAVLAGLACLGAAGTEAAEIGEDVAVAVSRTVSELAYGELLDVERAFDTELSLPDYVELVSRKTGVLFQLCCRLGGLESVADGEEAHELIAALGAFGLNWGIAFQILDDCLDLENTGNDKPAGTDHQLGLFGAPTLAALRTNTSGELSELLLSPSFDSGDLPRVCALVAAHGGFDSARDLAKVHLGRASAALDRTPDVPARWELAGMAGVA
ncbi:octaprenyl-diphosphate synthase [Amycolatopsis coloradensis]|uniref:Octaprenyl-diphosphate synthase n=1 Tax=Amycolatopsis coloradensis TaxID=76021 RepID=A0A1R0L2V8_9PSEU|nr:polyprenyl synthetase family protein [Amycolatopsis coloradensis]OLZ56693.1 octaprenyl-diphosphate synthase [Amycolatopsis coloradensis]